MATEGRKVTFPSHCSDRSNLIGMLYGSPATTKKALIVLHAWWGMNEEIQKHGFDIHSESGLAILVPDLYRGKVAKDRETAKHYMDDLDWQGAIKDVAASAKFLKSQGFEKVGIMGFCMGGALTFLAALHIPDISAASPFYGIPKPHLGDLTKIAIPVQSHFGEEDNVAGLSSPDDYFPLEYQLKKAGVHYKMYVYEEAGHGFCHRSYPTYHEDAANTAFKRMYRFMQEHLS